MGWSNIQNALASVQPAPSRLGGLASVISKVADRLKQERTAQAELGQKQNLLGYAGLMEGKIEPTETGGTEVPGIGRVQAVREPKEYKPITREDALEFEREKVGIKAQDPKTLATQKRQNLVDSTKIREEFINRPEVKEYTTINTQVKSMDSLLKKAKEGDIKNKVALDQGLITMFNKLTDPNSVVRESEYARTPQNLSLVNRFSGAIQKVNLGGAGLTDADREALVWGAKVIANERGNTYNQTLEEYKNLSSQYGIEEGLITRGVKSHKEYNVGSEDAKNIPYKIGSTIQKNGKTYTYLGNNQWSY